ncbi:MAG: iron-containing alcohol dehydrogenase [Ignavibacteria bacterium]|nr:iron-containing alcohol dehydrogenase [Ignavibacteria bacterium]
MGGLSKFKFLVPEFVFGAESRFLAGRYSRNLGASKVLLVTDAGVTAAGWPRDVISCLEHEGINYHVFSDVSPNPRDHEVMTGAKVYHKERCNAIVAIGGGSVIDCAKGIGIVATNNKDILQFEGVDMVPVPMPPLVCIPTTAGTSADVSQFAIIADTAERLKIAIISKSVVPDISLIDPETLLSMDPFLTACTGIDALVHALEAYVSNAASAITDMHALEAIRLIGEFLQKSILAPADLNLRAKIMQASLHAGLAFSNASLGCVHAMAHSLGGYLDLPHGECNALLLPHVVDFNFLSAIERYKTAAGLLHIPIATESESEARKIFVRLLNDFRLEAGITSTLRKKGVTEKTTSVLAKQAFKDPCNATNPRVPTNADLELIFKEAL